MVYRVGETDEVEKALFLRRFGVPFWGLTYVFGHNDMYWQRMVIGLGRNEIVGTTVKDPDRLPEHVLADEAHLTEAYGHFKQEAQRLNAHYQPQTVNTDGWSATQLPGKPSFPLSRSSCAFSMPSCPFATVPNISSKPSATSSSGSGISIMLTIPTTFCDKPLTLSSGLSSN